MKESFFVGIISFFIGLVGGTIFLPTYYSPDLMVPIVFQIEHSKGNPLITVNGLPIQRLGNDVYALTMNSRYEQIISVNGQKRSVRLDRLQKGDFIPLKLVYKDKTEFLKLHTVPDTMPEYVLEKSEMKDGYILTSFHVLTLDKASYAVIIDTDGKLVYYHATDNPYTTMFHMQQFRLPNGKIFYSHHIQTQPSQTGAWILGDNVVMDEQFNQIERVRILPTKRHPEMPADQHDFVILGDKHYLVISYWNEPYTLKDGTKTTIVSAVVQEQKDGKVVFDWVSSDYPKTFDMCVEKCPSVYPNLADYMHINAVAVDPKDNHLLLSLASPYAVVKIDRHSGKIIWVLSGEKDDFNLEPQYRLTRQHDAHMENGELVVFDNAYSSLGSQEQHDHFAFFKHDNARMLRFRLDEKNHKMLSVSELSIKTTAPYMGSAQQLSDKTVFIGCGSSSDCAALAFDTKNNNVLKLTVEHPYTTYRAYFVDSLD